MPIITTYIGEYPLNTLIDTGAEISVVNTMYAEKLEKYGILIKTNFKSNVGSAHGKEPSW